jgi:hypothetical protein
VAFDPAGVAPIDVAKVAQRPPEPRDHPCGRDGQGDIDDRLGVEAWYRGAAHVLDVHHQVPYALQKGTQLSLEEAAPLGAVGDHPHGVPLQADRALVFPTLAQSRRHRLSSPVGQLPSVSWTLVYLPLSRLP